MWIKDFKGSLINLDAMFGITIQKLNGAYVLIIIRTNDAIKGICLCKSQIPSKLEAVYNYIEEGIKNGVPFIDIKKYVRRNNLVAYIETCEEDQ